MQFQSIDFFIFLAITAILYYRSSAHIQIPVALLAVFLPLLLHQVQGHALLLSCVVTITLVAISYVRKHNKETQARKALLCVANLIFYAYYPRGAILLGIALIVSLCTFLSARAINNIDKPMPRRICLAVSVVVVLIPLLYFKYSAFFIENIRSIFSFPVTPSNPRYLRFFLPAGISFYSFKAVSYLVDVYRQQITARTSLVDVVAYVTFFPAILAGPIDRSKAFFSQLYSRSGVDAIQIKTSILLIIAGMLKKLIVADALKPIVDQTFKNPEAYSGVSLLLAAYTYSFQLYCDFAGYTDIAIGCALLLGFQIPPNFMRPYFAPNIAEFWRRWHMSLSYWLRDYVYIPLGGSRATLSRTCCNLLITMLIAGLWHGAGWNFIVWGALHGGMLVMHRLFRQLTKTQNAKTGKILSRYSVSVLANFSFVTGAWIFFRAETWQHAITIITRILQGAEGLTAPYVMPLVLIPLFIVTEIIQSKMSLIQHLIKYPLASRMAIYCGILLIIMLISSTRPYSFVYFRF